MSPSSSIRTRTAPARDAREAATVPLFLFGARGMLAGELLRLLELHPGLTLAGAVSRETGSELHRHLGDPAHAVDQVGAVAALRARLARGERAAVVLALPHGESARTWLALRDELGPAAEELFVLDLAADFRLRDPERYHATYGHAHPAPDELARFVYGLPELAREPLHGARRVAAPGCFATALQLAVLPAAEAGLLDPARAWILNGITGSSGSGNEPKPATHHPHRHGNLWAYSVGGHRHEAELLQALEPLGQRPPLAFVAHSGPFTRGIHLTATLPLARALDADTARTLYAERYRGEPFVEVLEGATTPDLRSVAGSNRVSLALAVRGEVLVVLLTLDNLVKGGAGQGLQCLNLMLGFPETAGLPRTGLGVS
ncbi:MAG TPA: N-acetyl-gamma-glutamyl-phosphate reductase [Planctomycetota bacterium]